MVAIVGSGLRGQLGSWVQAALLPDRDEPDAQPSCDRGAEHEAAGFDPRDLRHVMSQRRGKRVDDPVKQDRVIEQCPHVGVAVGNVIRRRNSAVRALPCMRAP